MQVKHDSTVILSHGQSIICKYIINIQDFVSKKSVYIFFYSQCFPYSWIKEGLKTEIHEKINEECNVSQNSVQADKVTRSHMMKFVSKTLFLNVRVYPVVCWKKKKRNCEEDLRHHTATLCNIFFYSSFMDLFRGQYTAKYSERYT